MLTQNYRRDKKDFKEHRISSACGEVPEKINFASQHQHESMIENPPANKLTRRAAEQLTARGSKESLVTPYREAYSAWSPGSGKINLNITLLHESV